MRAGDLEDWLGQSAIAEESLLEGTGQRQQEGAVSRRAEVGLVFA